MQILQVVRLFGQVRQVDSSQVLVHVPLAVLRVYPDMQEVQTLGVLALQARQFATLHV